MTTIHFIRHAQADNNNLDDLMRPLTQKGLTDRALVTNYLSNQNINKVVSSNYKRALDTISPFAEKAGLDIEIIADFRERVKGSTWAGNHAFPEYMAKQWADFSYKLPDGESLSEVQSRAVTALKNVLSTNAEQNIAIAIHGTTLSTIINYFDNSFSRYKFERVLKMPAPWVVKMTFAETTFINMEMIDLFAL
jgi:2,3-bisphosphoglycerate-dependent phosphoglycerate mutase